MTHSPSGPPRSRAPRPAWFRMLSTCLAVLALPALASAQDAGLRWGPTPEASSYGDRFDDLFALITWLVSASFAIVCVLLVIPMVRDRARPGHKAHYDHGSSLKDKRFTAIVSVAVFVILDAWVLFIAMQDLREGYWNIPKGQENVLRVEVLGQQWAWNFRTPGLDGEFGTADDVVSINELHVQRGQPVVFNLSSKDVIHSFFLPDMRLKRDANPGAINMAWFEPEIAGTYDILCAELCGFAHYQMHGTLVVHEPEAFAEWEREADQLARVYYDENDLEAQWAWDWRE